MKSFKKFHNVLKEGGAFGHLSHPFDVHTFTFTDLEEIIDKMLSGKLDYVEEKSDGINLMFTYRYGQIRASRNKGHLKNRGETALDVKQMADKFSGRGTGVAYVSAMNDIHKAISSLTPKQVEKVFDDGRNWMSIEVMMPVNAENVIKYGVTEIRFHGTIKHDDDGNAIEQINKENARMLDGMLRQRDVHKQDTFELKNLPRLNLPSVKELDKKKSKYLSALKKIMKGLGAKPKMTMRDVRVNYFNNLLNKLDVKGKLQPSTRNTILKRWVDYDKRVNLRALKKELPDYMVDGFTKLEKQSSAHNKQLVLPLETLFLKVGGEVLQMMGKFMAVNPNKVVAGLKKQVDDTAKKVIASGDPKLIQKLEYELNRLEQIGGWDTVVPSEGITFLYKGELLKATAQFAPINQLIGLRFRLPLEN